jgi:DNA-binding MarR family transcriptional regulator
MDAPDLDAVIHQPTRLRILAALYKARRLGHTRLRDELSLTDGNVATHTRRLEAAGYVRARRVLEGLSFAVVYEITPEGSTAFRAYVDALAAYLEGLRGPGL